MRVGPDSVGEWKCAWMRIKKNENIEIEDKKRKVRFLCHRIIRISALGCYLTFRVIVGAYSKLGAYQIFTIFNQFTAHQQNKEERTLL